MKCNEAFLCDLEDGNKKHDVHTFDVLRRLGGGGATPKQTNQSVMSVGLSLSLVFFETLSSTCHFFLTCKSS